MLASASLAQSVEPGAYNEQLGLLYTRDISCGFRLTTNGWAAFGNLSKRINQDRSSFYQLEFAEFKNPAENKQASENWANVNYAPRRYVFGKQNVFFALHFGLGRKIMLGEKAEKSGVAVSFNYVLGGSLGILKPYYLDLIYDNDPGNPSRRYVESHKYDPDDPEVVAKFLDFTQIYGSSGLARGLNEIKPVPGIHLKAAFNFDWAEFGEFIKAIEAGATADIYYKRIPIMVADHLSENPNRAYFVGLYVALMLGRKW
jgi:hypothetical protein